MTHKNRRMSRIFMFHPVLNTGCSLLRAEGFSYSLGVLYGGQGISKLQFLIKKIEIKYSAINFFQFQVIKPWIRIRNPESGSGFRKSAQCLRGLIDWDLYLVKVQFLRQLYSICLGYLEQKTKVTKANFCLGCILMRGGIFGNHPI